MTRRTEGSSLLAGIASIFEGMGSLFDISGRSTADQLAASRARLQRVRERQPILGVEEALAADVAALQAGWDAVAKDMGHTQGR